jgi:predicted NAD/FAD-binding protein
LLNRLQRIPFQQPVVVSLNPLQAIDSASIVGEYDYAHPVFDLAAIEAQKRLPLLQGQEHTWYAGAWTGYGFHEDGLKSGLQVGRALLQQIHGQGSTALEKLAA